MNGRFTEWSAWTKCSLNCGKGVSTRVRTCTAPKRRCGGAPCDPTASTNEIKECSGKCLGNNILKLQFPFTYFYIHDRVILR